MPKNANKSAKFQHSSLLQQNSVKIGRDFTRAGNFFTQALLACSYVFPSPYGYTGYTSMQIIHISVIIYLSFWFQIIFKKYTKFNDDFMAKVIFIVRSVKLN